MSSFDNPSPSEAEAPTIVMTPGGLTSTAGLARLSRRLTDAGFSVIVMPLDVRGIETDTAVLLELLASIDGSKIVVGHGYGGMLISHAGCVERETRALVFVAAFAPEYGESIADLMADSPGAGVSSDPGGRFTGDPAWRHLPAWFVYGAADEAIPPTLHAWMAARAGAVATTVVPGAGHDLIAEQPVEVLRVIRQAVDATIAQMLKQSTD